ncbi:MAG: selenium-dependent molybdenum cofactor biosynthesis protein YqeB [Deltaproteobacteria bacterium]|nr:selenium-dependent molybdenum cofactor biosynthesis protein YqeB [Deltaproteobacteria bacterium]
MKDLQIVIKGAGEMATGIACRLFMANLHSLVMLEIPMPISVRRGVSFSEAVYEREKEVEGVKAEYAGNIAAVYDVWGRRNIAVSVDPQWGFVKELKPDVVIDAVMAKRNIGTQREEASLVIGVGPGFAAPRDVHAVVESNRGHNLGKVIYSGSAESHTDIPGSTMGYTRERVLRAPHGGKITHNKDIGDKIMKGDLILYVDKSPVFAPLDGILRGLIREIEVAAQEKIGDIDPRGMKEHCYTITDKARAIGGGVLEAIMHFSEL